MNDPRLDPVQLHITATNELARVLRALRGPCADYDAIYERMARAMGLAEQAGREAFLAGRIEKKFAASPSSPMAGRVV